MSLWCAKWRVLKCQFVLCACLGDVRVVGLGPGTASGEVQVPSFIISCVHAWILPALQPKQLSSLNTQKQSGTAKVASVDGRSRRDNLAAWAARPGGPPSLQ